MSNNPMTDTQACDLMRILATEAVRLHPMYRVLEQAVRDLNGILASNKISRDRLNEVVGNLECQLFDYED